MPSHAAGETNQRQVPVPIVSGQDSDQRKAHGGAFRRDEMQTLAFRDVLRAVAPAKRWAQEKCEAL